MNRVDEQIGEKPRRFHGSWRDAVAAAERWARVGVGPTVLLACLLFFGLVVLRHWPVHGRAGMPVTARRRPQTPFEASFAQAQDGCLRAQVMTKGQLESLEEWDPNGIRGSAPEAYRRNLIARTQEIARAESAARDAARRATTNPEVYRATRLLVHIAADLEARPESRWLGREISGGGLSLPRRI